jgi:hypothetical protein
MMLKHLVAFFCFQPLPRGSGIANPELSNFRGWGDIGKYGCLGFEMPEAFWSAAITHEIWT